MSRAGIEELFKQARERGSIEKESGVRRGRRGPCPMCSEAGVRKKGDDAFSHHGKTGLWKCFRGCGGGDVVTLVCQMKGFDRLTAARWIVGLPLDGSGDPAGPAAPPSREDVARREREAAARRQKAQRSEAASAAYHAEVIASLDADAHPALVSPGVRRYLVARRLPVDHAEGWLDDVMANLMAQPAAHHSEDFETGEIFEHPAMVAVIEDCITGEIVGRHVTYLRRDGVGKADVEPARKIWGSARGGVWLTAREPELGPCFVGEGIETAASMLVAWRMKHGRASGRALALLSLENLQGRPMKDRFGRIDPVFPRADPERPAVTWGRVGRVVIGPDHDMKPMRFKARKLGGGTEEVLLDATARMEMSARLAGFWWTRAGGNQVEIARPPRGMDFNDAWRADQGARAA